MHKNNFHFLRLLFAVFVIITHTAINETDPLRIITNQQISFSYIGLRGFFIISGFLIFKSLINSVNLVDFLKKRILRIFPALFVVLVFTAFIVGPIVTTSSLSSYFNSKDVWTYVPTHLQLFIGFNNDCLPNVFSQNYSCLINVSLWTIAYEFLFYLIVGGLIFFRKNLNSIKISGILLFIILNFVFFRFSSNNIFYINFPKTNFELSNLIDLGLFFLAGLILSTLKFDEFKYKKYILIASLMFFLITLLTNSFNYFSFIILPLLVISFGTLNTKYISNFGNIGDFSYGTYLYACVVQHIFLNYFTLNYWQLAFLTIPTSIFFGALSWYFIEKPFLKLKKKNFSANKFFRFN